MTILSENYSDDKLLKKLLDDNTSKTITTICSGRISNYN